MNANLSQFFYQYVSPIIVKREAAVFIISKAVETPISFVTVGTLFREIMRGKYNSISELLMEGRHFGYKVINSHICSLEINAVFNILYSFNFKLNSHSDRKSGSFSHAIL